MFASVLDWAFNRQVISYKEADIYLTKRNVESESCFIVHNAVEAVNRLHLWEWVRLYEPGDAGYVFAAHPNIDAISNATLEAKHTMNSFGWTMRFLKRMAVDYLTSPEMFKE